MHGVSINPVAFVIVNNDSIKVMPIEHTSAIDKLMDYIPDLMQRANNIVNKSIDTKKEMKDNENDSNKANENMQNEIHNSKIYKNKKSANAQENTNLNNENNKKENENKNDKNKEQKRVINKNIVKTKNRRKEPKIEEIEITFDEDEEDNLEDE